MLCAAGMRGADFVVQWQTRKEEFRCSIGFFEMRISGENESFDSESVIFPHSFCDCLSVPDQSGTSTATNQPDTSPKVWADFQGGAGTIASIEFLQGNHSLLAGRVVSRHPCPSTAHLFSRY